MSFLNRQQREFCPQTQTRSLSTQMAHCSFSSSYFEDVKGIQIGIDVFVFELWGMKEFFLSDDLRGERTNIERAAKFVYACMKMLHAYVRCTSALQHHAAHTCIWIRTYVRMYVCMSTRRKIFNFNFIQFPQPSVAISKLLWRNAKWTL